MSCYKFKNLTLQFRIVAVGFQATKFISGKVHSTSKCNFMNYSVVFYVKWLHTTGTQVGYSCILSTNSEIVFWLELSQWHCISGNFVRISQKYINMLSNHPVLWCKAPSQDFRIFHRWGHFPKKMETNCDDSPHIPIKWGLTWEKCSRVAPVMTKPLRLTSIIRSLLAPNNARAISALFCIPLILSCNVSQLFLVSRR